MILYVLSGMDRTAKVLGGCWLAAGILYYLILPAPARKIVDSA